VEPQPNTAAWTSYGNDVHGSPVPRLWTPPLRNLDEPGATYGYELIDFAAMIGWPLKPWQQWLAIHAGELLPDGRPRFRIALTLVSRQNGKTVFCRVLTLFWMHVDQAELILGTSTSRDKAKQSWRKVIEMAERADILAPEYGSRSTRETIGEESFSTLAGSEYRFAAPNRRAGRGDTVHRLILDELREHQTRDTYAAAVKAMNAAPYGQAYAITNQGDSRSIVLDSLRTSAIDYIETGDGDPRLGLFEWSAPTGASPTDVAALAQANPQLGDTILLDTIMGDAVRAERAGGEELAEFRTEVMCIRVKLLDPAIDEEAWTAAGVEPAAAADLAEHRRRVALCLDVALDGSHATLVAAAQIDGVTHLEVIKAWSGFGCTKQVRADVPDLVAKIRPRAFGWFPQGPAAAIAASLKERPGRRSWPPPRVTVAELTAETAAVCMGFADVVAAGEVQHPRDPLLTGQVTSVEKLKRGDAWTFTRQGVSPIDAAYAAAGAAHLARTLPPAPSPLVVVTAGTPPY
jgi:hypothetical protein